MHEAQPVTLCPPWSCAAPCLLLGRHDRLGRAIWRSLHRWRALTLRTFSGRPAGTRIDRTRPALWLRLALLLGAGLRCRRPGLPGLGERAIEGRERCQT